ncbi:MAG: hypothetical protein ACLPPV_02900 [Candidatus Korobacteraceae bacterium]|jgi:hypothetical protein
MRFWKTFFVVSAVLLLLMFCLPAVAQGPAESTDLTVQDQTTSPPAPPKPAPAADDDGWHFNVTPYLWFPGVSGTAGVRGHYASVHASPGDLLSNFHIGLMGNLEARKGRLVMPLDVLWINLQTNKAVSFDPGVNSVKAGLTETLVTPKIGYRIVDGEKVKIDALVGFRYWYLGESLRLQPQLFNGLSKSQSWVDGVAGGKFEFALSPKASITVAGDAGGGGSQLDYQAVGAFGLRLSRVVVLDLGYRYLYVNYLNSPPASVLLNAHTSGAFLGVTFNLK